MRNFIDQAEKNGIILHGKGTCQFCGGDFQKGIFECIDYYNNGPGLLDFNDPGNQLSRFLIVDAHALQHPEIHGRWSNHFHLTRLNLILDKKLQWTYKKSPMLSDYLNQYKINRSAEFLSVPKPLERGNITAKDLAKATTKNQCIEFIEKWANEVYHAWGLNHSLVSQISDGFIARHGFVGIK